MKVKTGKEDLHVSGHAWEVSRRRSCSVGCRGPGWPSRGTRLIFPSSPRPLLCDSSSNVLPVGAG